MAKGRRRTTPQKTVLDYFIGARIRRLRTERGMTMNDLAARLNLSYQQVQKYETGANRLSAAQLFILAQIFSVPLTAFFPAQEEREDLRGSAPPHGGVLRPILTANQCFSTLSPEMQTAVCALIKAAAQALPVEAQS